MPVGSLFQAVAGKEGCVEGGGGGRLWRGSHRRPEGMCWQNGREDSRRHRADQGGWENGMMGTHILGGDFKGPP